LWDVQGNPAGPNAVGHQQLECVAAFDEQGVDLAEHVLRDDTPVLINDPFERRTRRLPRAETEEREREQGDEKDHLRPGGAAHPRVDGFAGRLIGISGGVAGHAA
jgi:hypothetical protein